jgi:hypothetical protein
VFKRLRWPGPPARSYSELRPQRRDEPYGVTVTVMMFDFTMPSAGLAQFIGQKT